MLISNLKEIAGEKKYMSKYDGEVWRTIHGRRVRISDDNIQKQLSLIFGNKRSRESKIMNLNSKTYKRIRDQVYHYRKKYKNGKSYYIDLDGDLYEVSVEKHEPIIHNKIKDYEIILNALDIKLGGHKK